MAEIAKPKGIGFWASFLPAFSWMTFFYFVPLAVLLSWSFYHHTYVKDVPAFSLESFKKIFSSALYLEVLWRTFAVAISATFIDAIIAFPVAYFLAFYAGRFRQALSILILLPLWSSYLVRIYSWTVILGKSGLINYMLLKLHVLSEPSPDFIYNLPAVTLVLCYIWLPFMVLPLTTAFERLPKKLLEASADLGAGPVRTFLKITTPLIFPGLLAGCLSVFSLSMGDYFTPSFMGRGSPVIGEVILRNFGVAANWPLSAAFSFVVLAVLMVIFGLLSFTGAFEAL